MANQKMLQEDNKISIIIIESNISDQLLLKEFLQSTNLDIHNIEMAISLGEGIQLLKEKFFSLVLLDLFLPDSNGLESYRSLLRLNPRIPVIILSGLSDTKISLKALSLGAQDFLIKGDYNIKILERAIRYSIERKKNLETIEENVERINMVSMATSDIVWDWNLKTGEVYSTKEGGRIILKDIDEKDPEGKKDVIIIHPEDRNKVKTLRDEIFLSKTQSLFEMECRTAIAGEKYTFVQDRGYVIRDKEGNPIRLIGATQDITRRKEAEQKVLLSELRFKSLVQNGSDLIAILDEGGNYMYVSPTSKRILGYESEFFIGKNAFTFIYPDDLQNVQFFFEKMKQVGTLDLPPYRFQNANGQWRWLETNITNLVDDEAVNGIVANSRDITERKLEEERAALEKIIRQKEITEAIISAQENERSQIGRELHDNVNQLLGATRLYIDMAGKDAENRDAYLKSSSTYTLNAINEIRKLSKTLITPLINEIGLVESVKDVISGIMEVHDLKIEFNTFGFEEKNLNEKFKLNLFRIVQEQINNTIKHAKATLMQINFKQSSANFFISICDNGIGFDTAISRTGIGINNLISRAELYKGKVIIDSKPGEGCTLTITFKNVDLLLN